MHAVAQMLSAQAATIAALGHNAESRYRLADFEGPAATHIGGRVQLVASGASTLADRLVEMSATVTRAASELEQEQAAYDRLVARLEAGGAR